MPRGQSFPGRSLARRGTAATRSGIGARGGGCGSCHDAIQEIIERVRAEAKPAVRPKLTTIQKIKMIEEAIEREIRPSLKHDGGNIELIDVVGNRVLVTMQWVWRYLTYQSGARLITTPAGKSMPRPRVDSHVSPPAGGATAGE